MHPPQSCFRKYFFYYNRLIADCVVAAVIFTPVITVLYQGSQSCKSMEEKIFSWKVMEKSWKMGQKIEVMEIENIMGKSWNFSTAYHESRTRSSDNLIY